MENTEVKAIHGDVEGTKSDGDAAYRLQIALEINVIHKSYE